MVTGGLRNLQPDIASRLALFWVCSAQRNFVYSLLDIIHRAVSDIKLPKGQFSCPGPEELHQSTRSGLNLARHRDRGARRQLHRIVGRRALGGGRLAGRAAEVRAAPEARPGEWWVVHKPT